MATASVNCEACEALRQEVPELVCNGFDDDMCASLANDTGLKTTSGHNDCTDLNNLNDCLIGNEAEEVELYEVCDWKPFMKDFINNLWTVLKAMICAICGIWTNIHNLWAKINEVINKIDCVNGNVSNVANAVASTTGGASFVRYFRDNSGQSGRNYFINAVTGGTEMLDIYMDADVDNAGSTPADKDYVVIISCCTNLEDFAKLELDVTFFSSLDTRDMSTIRKRMAQHPGLAALNGTAKFDALSVTTTGAVLIKQGGHVKVESHVSAVNAGGSGTPHYRLHQFSLTWIPVNIDSGFDPSSVIVAC